jgi:hydroxymethylpyrimidine/phosphomethylpyrimidine kinase
LLTDDIPVHACKLGLIGSIGLVDVIGDILDDMHAGLPVVFDPVLAAGSGKKLADRKLITAMRKRLFGLTTILTPNAAEARRLTHRKDIHAAAEILLQWGCESVLVTGADEQTPRVNNLLFGRDFVEESFEWERLPGVYHGSGCTLSSSIAAGLARGQDIRTAVARAQEFTWQSLKHSYQLGSGQKHPNRFFSMDTS